MFQRHSGNFARIQPSGRSLLSRATQSTAFPYSLPRHCCLPKTSCALNGPTMPPRSPLPSDNSRNISFLVDWRNGTIVKFYVNSRGIFILKLRINRRIAYIWNLLCPRCQVTVEPLIFPKNKQRLCVRLYKFNSSFIEGLEDVESHRRANGAQGKSNENSVCEVESGLVSRESGLGWK